MCQANMGDTRPFKIGETSETGCPRLVLKRRENDRHGGGRGGGKFTGKTSLPVRSETG